jgi:GAF domain-containing protein
MAGDEQLLDLEAGLAEVALALFERGTVEVTLQRIVDLAEHAVDGCEAAGILVVDDGIATTAAASSALVDAIDQLQIDAGAGPCIDASNERSTFYAQDLLDETRWPAFASDAAAAGIRSVLAYPLLSDRPSALNLYSRYPGAFGATDRAQGVLFATLARLAVDSAEERETDEQKTMNFAEALRTRELIGQAQGILMERERVTGEQAFDILRRASQHMNVKLREVAQTLVETGESPTVGREPKP